MSIHIYPLNNIAQIVFLFPCELFNGWSCFFLWFYRLKWKKASPSVFPYALNATVWSWNLETCLTSSIMNDDVLLHVNPFAWRPCSETHPMIGCQYERPSARSDSNAMACSRVGAPSHGSGVGRFVIVAWVLWYGTGMVVQWGPADFARLTFKIQSTYRQYTSFFSIFFRKVQLHITFSQRLLLALIGYHYGVFKCRVWLDWHGL